MPRIEYTNETSTDGWTANTIGLNVDTMPENGFLTEIGLKTQGSGGSASGRLCVYSGLSRIFSDAAATWNTTISMKTAAIPSIAVASGTTLRWGGAANGAWNYSYGGTLTHSIDAKVASYPPPTTLSALTTSFTNRAMRGYLEYTPNVAPLQPTWRNPGEGTSVSLTPTWEVNLLQGADSALDTIDDVQLQIRRASDDVVVHDVTYATTATERTNGYFTRAPATLAASTAYKAKARTRDSFGVWSTDWTVDLNVTTVPAPSGAPTAPIGKVNAISGYNYTAAYTNPAALNADRAQIIVTNASGVTLYDSGEVVLSPTIAPGGTISVAEWHTDLAWATSYKWKIKVRDTGLSWGSYSDLASFNTNAPPNAPTNQSPANSKVTSSRLLTANVTDPDGDTVAAAEIELYNVTDSVVVDTYTSADGVAVASGAISFTVPSLDVTLGKTYKWRARGTDGNPSGYGAWSNYAFWVYQNVPVVTMVGPLVGRVNVVAEPSAEYTPGTFWTETARSAGVDEINRVNDADVAFGEWAWEAVCSAGGDNRLRMTNYRAVDPTKAHPFFIWARKLSGTSATHFNVLAYDASNTLLGTLQPNSEGALNGTNIGTTWQRYGGIVYHTGSSETIKWPAGTTKYKIEITPSRNSAATVRFDALDRAELSPITSAEWAATKNWLGYADGDTTGYGTDLYSWTGTPGDSESNVLSRLTSVPASVVINYSHASSLAKTNDRLIIEKWNGLAWSQIYDANPTWVTNNSNRTIIPIPANTIKNEGRYRLKVQARDTVPNVGESDWAEFDVLYTGPAQLNVTVVEENEQKAEISLTFDPSALAPAVFDRAELQVNDLTTSEVWIEDVSTDPAVTKLTFFKPISGHTYEISVRQIEVVGAEFVEGRWATFEASVDYFPYFFVKDADNPSELYVAYETEASSLGSTGSERPSAIFAPWGAAEEIVLVRNTIKSAAGQVNAQFFPDALGQEDHLVRYEKMKEILERGRTVILMQQVPDAEVIHAAVIGEYAKGWIPPRTPTLAFNWRRVGFEPDYYKRQGVS